MHQAFQVFREVVAAATTMGRSTALATPVAGGVRQSSIQQMLGTASCITVMVTQTGTTALSTTVSRCVALGIRPFDSLTLCPFDNLKAPAPIDFREGESIVLQ